MRVLSLFDGISCGRVALERAGIPVEDYFASEIEKSAIKVSSTNWPDIKQVGSVVDLDVSVLGKIDLLIGGSPCQGFSMAGKKLNFDDPRSKLFFEFSRIKKEAKPRFWMLENVSMKSSIRDEISRILECDPVEICSSSFSAQRRKRLYWTNIKFSNDFDFNGPSLSEIIDESCEDSASDSFHKWFAENEERLVKGRRVFIAENEVKAPTLTKSYPSNWNGCIIRVGGDRFRFLTVGECEVLQTLPVGYCNSVSKSKAYEALGNGWTVDVIAHIFRGMK